MLLLQKKLQKMKLLLKLKFLLRLKKLQLHRLKKLRHLSCGAFFPDAEFIALQKASPNLDCSWFSMIEEYGSIRKGLAAFSERMKRS